MSVQLDRKVVLEDCEKSNRSHLKCEAHLCHVGVSGALPESSAFITRFNGETVSRTLKGSKGSGYEYWKSRFHDYYSEGRPGRYTKKLTHKYERRQAKRACQSTEE